MMFWNTSVEIHGSAEHCWEILLDFSAYEHWNSSLYFKYIQVRGTLPENKGVKLVEKIMLLKQPALFWSFPMDVVINRTHRTMEWTWTYPEFIMKFFKMSHHFAIISQDENHITFIHRTDVTGYLAKLLQRFTHDFKKIKVEHEKMNNDLSHVCKA